MTTHVSRVLLIYTGGTIGMGKNPSTGALEPLDVHHLIGSMPEIAAIPAAIDVHQFPQPVDSSDMNPTLWARLTEIIAENYDLNWFMLYLVRNSFQVLKNPLSDEPKSALR